MVRPFTSVTVQVTVVVPTGKVAGALFVVLCTPQLSPVVGVPKFTFALAAPHIFASAGCAVIAAGAVMDGS